MPYPNKVIRVLSVRPPWGLAMFSLGKNIENRSRPFSYRGILAIHTSLHWSKDWANFLESSQYTPKENPIKEFLRRPVNSQTSFYEDAAINMGRIIGTVQMYDCVDYQQGKTGFWGIGPKCWMIRSPIFFQKPIKAKGQLAAYFPGQELLKEIQSEIMGGVSIL
jgi:hypothetical protein